MCQMYAGMASAGGVNNFMKEIMSKQCAEEVEEMEKPTEPDEMSDNRDADRDLAVCEAAEKWFEIRKNLFGWIDMCLPKDVAYFIATTRESLPYWINRALKAEAENARLQVEKQDLEAERGRCWRSCGNRKVKNGQSATIDNNTNHPRRG